MPKIVEYCLQRGGIVKRRIIDETDIAIPDTIADQLAVNINFRCPAAFMMEGNPVDMVVKNGGVNFYTITLDAIILNTAFRMKETTMFPVFNGTENVMSLPWPAQKGMTIRFTVAVATDIPSKKHRLSQVYLFAFDAHKQAYKLPLANLYDDCRLCHGQNSSFLRTGADVLLESLRNFGTSRWNGDLWKDAEKSQKMFSFNATKEGFSPIEVKDWIALCDKVATPISEISMP